MKKLLIAGAFVVLLVVFGIDQARQDFLRRAEAREWARERQAAAERIRELEGAREEATNLLAAVKEENARLKSAQTLTELLRLRGQVGALRQELAASGPASTPNMLVQMERDPAMKNMMREGLRQWFQYNYGQLFKELKLTPEQTRAAIELCADASTSHFERLSALHPGAVSQDEIAQMEDDFLAEYVNKLQPLLGDNGVSRFKEIRDEMPARATLELLNGQLGGSQLNEDQSTRLIEIMKTEPFELTSGMLYGLDEAFWGTPQDIQDHVLQIEDSNSHVLQQAGGFLTPDQLAALSTVLSNGITYRLGYADAYLQQH